MYYKTQLYGSLTLVRTLAFLLILSCIACKNNTKSAEKKDASVSKNQASPINSDDILDMPAAQSLPFLIEPCETSTNYQKNNWPGENSCIWAMQKELLNDLPEYVIKKDGGLSFQTDNAGWRNLLNTKDNKLMLNAYLPKFHLFILKYFNVGTCEKYGIYDPRANKLTDLEGKFYLDPDMAHFAVVPSKDCKASELIVGSFSNDKRVITKTIKVSNPVLTLRWKENKLAFSTKKGENKDAYQMIELP